MIPGNIPKSDAIELDDDPSLLRIPDVAGLSLAAAALAYAKAGWYVLPTDPADIKNPGSVVHGHWQDKSTREPEQIRAWWRESPGNGIALHLGKSGAVAFDLDIDDLDVIARAGRPDIAEALRSAVVIQTTRRQGDRGHYQWKRVGALHRLPEALRASLLAPRRSRPTHQNGARAVPGHLRRRRLRARGLPQLPERSGHQVQKPDRRGVLSARHDGERAAMGILRGDGRVLLGARSLRAAAHADPACAHHTGRPLGLGRFAYRPQLARFARLKWHWYR